MKQEGFYSRGLEHLKWFAHKSHVYPSGCTVITALAPFIRPIDQFKKNMRWIIFVLLDQFQRLAFILLLRPPIKWERKLESKHFESPDSTLRPPGEVASPSKSYFNQGRPSLKKLLVLFFYEVPKIVDTYLNAIWTIHVSGESVIGLQISWKQTFL